MSLGFEDLVSPAVGIPLPCGYPEAEKKDFPPLQSIDACKRTATDVCVGEKSVNICPVVYPGNYRPGKPRIARSLRRILDGEEDSISKRSKLSEQAVRRMLQPPENKTRQLSTNHSWAILTLAR